VPGIVATGVDDPSDPLAVGRAALAERIDRCRKAWGAIGAIVDRRGTHLFPHGRLASDDPRAPDADTVFEVGCIVRVFDALLLCDMAERGDVRLSDPARDYLPRGTYVPERGGAITLQHLAMQTSGLPGRRTARAAETIAQTTEGLYRVLAETALTSEVGTLHDYSLIGTSLLRHALSRRAGLPYDVLLKTRVFDQLAMRATRLGPPPDPAPSAATGHNDRLEAVPPHPSECRSTARDLSIFLEICLALRPSPLDAALARMLSVRHPITAGVDAALGWNVETHGGDEIVCLEGVSWGFRGWIGYRPAAGRAAAILSNAAAIGGVQDIGYHALDPAYPLLTSDQPLLQPPTRPVAIDLPADQLEAHVGRYQLTPNVFVEITREGRQLFAEKTAMSRVPIHPETPVQFFCTDVDYFELPGDTRLVFAVADARTTSGLTLRQRGQEVWLPRVGRDAAAAWFGHVRADVEPDRLARCAGRYCDGAFDVTVSFEDGTLVAEFGGRLRVPLVPESATQFFIENDVMNVQIVFEVDGDGRVGGLVGTYDGVRRRGVRVE
jgi:CubicO group peptidase (beta-lactamase class C family)